MQNLYYSNSNYYNIDDEELITLIKEKNDKNALNYLLDKYTELVNMKVSKYFIVGAEREDIVQEGLIGLFKAVRNFDSSKLSSFKTFANLCIERQLQTAIKSSNRQKHIPLNSYLSLNTSAYEDNDDTSIMEVFDSNTAEDPLDTVTKKEYYKFVENRIEETLSDFEKQVLHRFANGESYVEISKRLDAPVKSVDNAIQRIRKKATKNILKENEM